MSDLRYPDHVYVDWLLQMYGWHSRHRTAHLDFLFNFRLDSDSREKQTN